MRMEKNCQIQQMSESIHAVAHGNLLLFASLLWWYFSFWSTEKIYHGEEKGFARGNIRITMSM